MKGSLVNHSFKIEHFSTCRECISIETDIKPCRNKILRYTESVLAIALLVKEKNGKDKVKQTACEYVSVCVLRTSLDVD